MHENWQLSVSIGPGPHHMQEVHSQPDTGILLECSGSHCLILTYFAVLSELLPNLAAFCECLSYIFQYLSCEHIDSMLGTKRCVSSDATTWTADATFTDNEVLLQTIETPR